MANISALADYLSPASGSARASADPLRQRLTALAELGRAASCAALCAVGWQGPGAPALVRAPADDPRFQAIGAAAFALLANQLEMEGQSSPRIFRVSAPELAARLGRPTAPEQFELTAAAASLESTAAIVLLITAAARAAAEVEAILEILVRAALAMAAYQRSSCSRDFWKERAQAVADQLAQVRRDGEQAAAVRRRIEDAVAEAARLKPRDLPAGVGRLLAAIGPFDAWVTALCEDGVLRVEASSLPWRIRALQPLDARSALFDSFSRAASILRFTDAVPGAPYEEDRLFARSRFASYLCLPFGCGVIGLGARRAIEPDAVARAEALVKRLAPTLDTWTLRREARARRALVQSLALRLYGAIDAERARIARDLHDDQAQLLAAARIALEAPPEKARRILRQLDRRLRVKLGALRPATLGRATLKAALLAELGRLADAGVAARLLRLERARAMPRGLQNVCYQVAREAISNIVRHARARHVEVSLERREDRARLSITDDGRGIGARRKRRGAGLAGLAERVALVGGSLEVDSRPGRTRVVAEIPVPPRWVQTSE